MITSVRFVKVGGKWTFQVYYDHKKVANFISAGYQTKRQAKWWSVSYNFNGDFEVYPVQQSDKKFFASMGMK